MPTAGRVGRTNRCCLRSSQVQSMRLLANRQKSKDNYKTILNTILLIAQTIVIVPWHALQAKICYLILL